MIYNQLRPIVDWSGTKKTCVTYNRTNYLKHEQNCKSLLALLWVNIRLEKTILSVASIQI